MIVGIARVIYFLGPVLCLAVVVLNQRRRLGWYCWAFSAAIVLLYWIFLLSAEEDGAVEASLIPIAIWSPLLATTLIAGLTRNRWLNWNTNPAVSQVIVVLLCVLPSAIAFFLSI